MLTLFHLLFKIVIYPRKQVLHIAPENILKNQCSVAHSQKLVCDFP